MFFLDKIQISQFSRRTNRSFVPQNLQMIGESNRIELFDIAISKTDLPIQNIGTFGEKPPACCAATDVGDDGST